MYRRSLRRRFPRRRRFRKRTTISRSRRRPRRLVKNSRKRILNVSSRRKRDTLAPFFTNAPLTGVLTPGGMNISGATRFHAFGWTATARNNGLGPGAIPPDVPPIGQIIDSSTRTSSTCYMVGLKENIRIETSSARPFVWRRICFTAKGDNYRFDHTPGSPNANIEALWATSTPSNGWTRLAMRMLGGSGFPSAEAVFWNQVAASIFKGTPDIDWTNPTLAALDTTRIKVEYDRTRTIRSGNDEGVIQTHKLWHPMRKNLVYNDREQAGGKFVARYSDNTRIGMGDYYVIDIYDTGIGGTVDDEASITCNSTLYWHER